MPHSHAHKTTSPEPAVDILQDQSRGPIQNKFHVKAIMLSWYQIHLCADGSADFNKFFVRVWVQL